MTKRKDASETRSVSADDRAVYIISVAAELAGVHPQTLRMYERKGLLQPGRSAGNTRRYSARDIERLRTIQQLTQEQGINLAGARLIMEMDNEIERMRTEMAHLRRELARQRQRTHAMGIVPLRTIVRMPWERKAGA
jgi:MerR family transcriptional regulator/heat shock protein HspR